jgi:predicted O-linked N-acetylglucosamine transferase (SPINDLY family)
MISVRQTLDTAWQLFQEGKWQQAERLYLQVLEAEPQQVDALHLLGVIASQTGRESRAIDCLQAVLRLQPALAAAHYNLAVLLAGQRRLEEALISYHQALRLKPEDAKAHNNLGIVLEELGQLAEAEASLQQALRIKPDYAEAHNNLGIVRWKQTRLEEAEVSFRQAFHFKPDFAEPHNNLGNVLKELGRLVEAEACYQQALKLKPEYSEAHNSLGIIFGEREQLVEAEASFRQGLRFKPDYAEAHCNLGIVLWRQRRLEEAEASYQQALKLKPDYAEAYNNLGAVLKELGRHVEAEAGYHRALHINPEYAEAHNNLGTVLEEFGRLVEAEASYHRALRIKPDYAEANYNLGNVLCQQRRLEEAEASYRQALRLKPEYAEAYNNLGIVFEERGQLVEAEASYRQALRFKPDHPKTYQNLGNTRKNQGRLDDAIAAYRTALALKPDAADIHSNLILALNYHPRYDGPAILGECARWNQQHAEPLKKLIRPHTNRPDPDRRLRIAYVSPGFYDHVDSFFTVPLLSNHDHRQCAVFCYADVPCPDAFTDRLRGYADIWRSTVGLTDQQLADVVRSDEIDILIDLSMHTARNRLMVFARKPAPVQVTWLAYPGTTGLSAIDYRLTDPHLDPPGLFDACYAEESVRLPETFWCYDPLGNEPPVNALPAFANGVITFGSLNNFCKVNEECLTLWARVLLAVPESRLVLLAPPDPARESVLAKLERDGIIASRVAFAEKRPRQEYLKLYHQIDIALDPLPYNGHTTSLDALWMGVPTLTLLGNTVAGRAGWSQLCNLGLQELTAETPDQHVALAARLAGDLSWLQELRRTLRQRMQRSPLMDGKRFATHVEQAYRQMWQRWCRDQPRQEPT